LKYVLAANLLEPPDPTKSLVIQLFTIYNGGWPIHPQNLVMFIFCPLTFSRDTTKWLKEEQSNSIYTFYSDKLDDKMGNRWWIKHKYHLSETSV
jgi:hypothetical protein